MRAFKTEGIILKRRDFGEADRILSAFTLHRGKLSILARGVRRITSRRAGNVELLNRVQMYLYPGKQFFYLTEGIALDTFQKLKEDLTLSTYAFHILELVDKLTVEDQEDRIIYADLLELLRRLTKNPRQILVRAFEAKVLSVLGFATFRVDNPGLDIQIQSRIGHLNLLEILKNLELGTWDEIEKLDIDKKNALALERILRYYIERVIEGKLKSRQFLKKL